MKKRKLRLYKSVVDKHKGLVKALWAITYFLGFPFVIFQLLGDLFGAVAEFGGNVRCKVVYGLQRMLFKKELQEVAKTNGDFLDDDD